jgi:dihydrofolate reductase
MLMGRIRVHEFTTLDGMIDTPTWAAGYAFDPKMGEAIGGIMGSCKSILFGRRTFEMFAPAWSKRTAQEDPGAPFMNDTPKFVVASSAPSGDWANSSVIGPYAVPLLSKLKEQVDGDLYVSGSGTLVRAMLVDGLIDELNLFVYPLTVGSGSRLFPDGAAPLELELTGCRSFSNGVVHASYRPTANRPVEAER